MIEKAFQLLKQKLTSNTCLGSARLHQNFHGGNRRLRHWHWGNSATTRAPYSLYEQSVVSQIKRALDDCCSRPMETIFAAKRVCHSDRSEKFGAPGRAAFNYSMVAESFHKLLGPRYTVKYKKGSDSVSCNTYRSASHDLCVSA